MLIGLPASIGRTFMYSPLSPELVESYLCSKLMSCSSFLCFFLMLCCLKMPRHRSYSKTTWEFGCKDCKLTCLHSGWRCTNRFHPRFQTVEPGVMERCMEVKCLSVFQHVLNLVDDSGFTPKDGGAEVVVPT